MKKTILTVSLILGTIFSYAQFSPSETHKSGTVYKNFSGASTIIEKEGTAQELYDLVKLYVLEHYVSQEAVIMGENEGQALKIRGIDNNIRYSLTFKFKEGKMKIDVVDLERRSSAIPSTRYTSYVPSSWHPIGDIRYSNSKGKVYGKGGRIYDSIDNSLNGMVVALNDYEAPENEDW